MNLIVKLFICFGVIILSSCNDGSDAPNLKNKELSAVNTGTINGIWFDPIDNCTLMIDCDDHNECYVKLTSHGFSNHLKGKLSGMKIRQSSSFNIDKCKSLRYGSFYIGFNIDSEVNFEEIFLRSRIQVFDTNGTLIDSITTVSDLELYKEVPLITDCYVIIDYDSIVGFSRDSFSIKPATTMLCIDSRSYVDSITIENENKMLLYYSDKMSVFNRVSEKR